MKKLEKVILIPLMLLTSLFVVPGIPYAHAAGQICLADPATTGCPVFPAAFDQAPGSLLRVAVRASGVDALNGFDIQVGSDPTVLTAVGADLTGSVIPFSALVICLNGVLQTGSSCSPQDADGVVHLAAVNTQGMTTTPPTNGLLFTAVFKVLAGSSGTPIFFNTGCTGTSLDGVCVTIANGVPGAPPIPVSTEEATFSHGPDYGFALTPASTTIAPGGNVSFTVTLTSQGGFTDTIAIAAASSTGATPGSFDCNTGNPIGGITFPPLGVTVSSPSLFLPSGGSATTTLNVGVAPQPDSVDGCDVNGNPVNLFPAWILTATGTSSGAVSHSANAGVQDAAQDFSISASPSNGIIVPFSSSRTSTLTLTSISAFADSVSFSTVTNFAGPTTSVSPSSVTLTPYGTATATLTINVPSTADFAAYDTTVTATATVGGQVHTVDVTYVVTGTDFNLAAVPDHIVTLASLSGSSNIKISSPLLFAGPLSYSAVVIPTATNTPANCSPCSTALGTFFSPASGTLSAGGLTITTLTIATTANSALGNYTIIVSVTSGSLTHRVFVTLSLGDFSLTLSPTALTVIPGTKATSTITSANLGGFGATNFIAGQNGISFFGATNPEVTRVPQLPGNPALRLVQVFYPNGTQIVNTIVFIHGVRTCADCGTKGPIASVPKRQIFPDPFFGPASTTLTVRVTAATPSGDYIVSVTGIGGPIKHTATAMVHVPQQPSFTQFVPFHQFTQSTSGGTLTTKAGVINNDGQTTLYIQIVVSGIDATGTKTFTATSAIIAIAPGQTINNIAYSVTFGPQTVGNTYAYSGSIAYGLSATALTASSSGGAPSGTLVIKA